VPLHSDPELLIRDTDIVNKQKFHWIILCITSCSRTIAWHDRASQWFLIHECSCGHLVRCSVPYVISPSQNLYIRERQLRKLETWPMCWQGFE
jgi:hypothetical protein